MFTNKKHVGTAQRVQTVKAYKKVTDWDAVWRTFVLILIALTILSAFIGE